MNALEAVAGLLGSIGAPYALIGGRAVAARGFPRMTLDYDLLTSEPRVLERDIWRPLEQAGATADPRKGDYDDPIAGVVHLSFTGGAEVDVILARWKWELQIIQRAEPLDVGGVTVPVPRTSDLILLKLAAGGPIDLQDAMALVETNRKRWIAEVDEKIAQVQPDVSSVWRRLKESL
jgi:hypothetical protein